MSTSPHVLIIGAGIGGLCLAQGLRQAGISAAVYERDRTPTDRLQGYRIHINPAGSRALHACLPPHLYDVFAATCGRSNRGFSFLSEQLEELLFLGADDLPAAHDPVESHKSVSRLTLRQVLLAGLEDAVHFDKTFTRYAETPDGQVVALFADGATASGDLLVGADGGSSRVRRQLLPHAERIDTGVLGIAAKVPLTDEVRALLPPRLFDGPAAIAAPRGRSMFVAVQEVAHKPSAFAGVLARTPDRAAPAGLLYDTERDYVMWGLTMHREQYSFRDDPERLDSGELLRVVQRLIAGWHPHLRQLVWLSDPATVAVLPIRSAVPIPHWETGRVTLLGDAIHSMTPARGIGANVALQDAHLLCQNLAAAQRGEKPLLQAVHDYEVEMVRYGFAAVRSSLRALEQGHRDSPLALALTRTGLRLLNAAPPLKRWAFRSFGNN